MVVCRAGWCVVESEERWGAEKEFHSWLRDFDHGVGDECASAAFGVEYDGAYYIWVYVDGCGLVEDH